MPQPPTTPPPSGARNSLDERSIERLVEFYVQDGLGTEEAGRRVGVCQATAARYLRAAGVQLRPAGGQLRSPELHDEALALRAAGVSPADIRRRLRVPDSTLRHWLAAR